MDQPDNSYIHKFEFIKIYDRYSDKIFRHLYFKLRDREKALDFMQETFMKTFVYMDKGPIGNIQAFLYKVANNLTIDEYKKKKAYSLEQMEEEKGFEPGIDTALEIKNKIDADKILEIIGQIPPPYQTVIIMRYVDELSIQEIAGILGDTENSISVKIHRGISHIRKLIHNYE